MRLQKIPTRKLDESSSISSSEDTPNQKNRRKIFKKLLESFDHFWPTLATRPKSKFNIGFIYLPQLLNLCHSLTTFAITALEMLVSSGESVSMKKARRVLLNVISTVRELRGGVLLMQLLKLDEVRAELGISRTTLWRLQKRGLIKSCRLGGLVWVTRGDLDHFIRQEILAGRSR
jgi:predicted DNA-binding transcriptional regulator AlpA